MVAVHISFEEAQIDIAPLLEKVRTVLLGAGFREYVFPNEVPGFALTPVTPEYGQSVVRVQHVDWPAVDVRPFIAQYNAVFEAAGIETDVIWDGVLDGKWADIEIKHKYVLWDIEP